MLNKILHSKIKSAKSERKCMFGDCSYKAIKSHVLQKSGILREISHKNHIVQHVPPSPFELAKKGVSDFKLVGINDAYTFYGFCKFHDSELFKSIENQPNVNLSEPKNQQLFFYRGLCQEIRRKEIAMEHLKRLRNDFPGHVRVITDELFAGMEIGIKSLFFFKKELELSLKKNISDIFYIKTIEIPKIELCVSTVINVHSVADYEKKITNGVFIFPTSFINIFPIGDVSYVICGYHKDFRCEWTDSFIKELETGANKIILKQLSDLIVLRAEFWAMSQNLFEQIGDEKMKRYEYLFRTNSLNYESTLSTNFNLFENL